MEDNVELVALAEVPLLGRLVNYPPLSSTHPKLKSYPLSELSSAENRRVQEALVVHDLLNVLVGLEGAYIRYNNSYDPYKDVTPEFKIAKVMDPSLKSFSKRIAKLGKHYVALNKAAERWSNLAYGVVLQRLGFEIKNYLRNTYLSFVVETLERNFKTNPNFSIREMEQMVNDFDIAKNLELLFTLYERIAREDKLRQNMDKMQEDFKNFMDDLKSQGELQNGIILATDTSILPIAKGGIALGIMQDLIHENLGDRSNVSFLKNLLNKIAEDYFETFKNWMTQGELNDPYDEFMIVDTMKHVNGISSLLKYGDRVWDTQYVIRKDGLLKQFFSQEDNNDLLFKLLITGKILNVLRTCLGLNKLPISETYHDSLIISNFTDLMEGNNLELIINMWYKRANELCLKMFLDGYDLHNFLKGLQKYYFGYNYSNGMKKFLSQNLLELTRRYRPNGTDKIKLQKKFELDKKYNDNNDLILELMTLQLDDQSFEETILPYVNQNSYEMGDDQQLSELKSTTGVETDDLLHANNFQNLKDILLREVRTSESHIQSDTILGSGANESAKQPKSNIHHLCFEIMVPYPLNIIVTRTCIVQYQIISRYLYILQYYSRMLDDTWLETHKNSIWKYPGYSQIVRQQIVKRCRILNNKMSQFTKLILEYFTQDVIEREMKNTSANIESIYGWQTGLQESLTNIMTNCCLSQLIEIQLQIFEIIHKFCKFITSMRRALCQLDVKLYQTFVYSGGSTSSSSTNSTASTKMKPFSEEQSSRMTSDLIKYINVVAQGFELHTIAFKEGLSHYHHNNPTSSTGGTTAGTANLIANENQSTRLLSSLNF